jgi:hypothetical protein
MPAEHVAVLKSLVLRPSALLAPNLEGIVRALETAGYVSKSPAGWIATAKGCEELERARTGENR